MLGDTTRIHMNYGHTHPDDAKLYKTVTWFVLQPQQCGKEMRGDGGGEDVQMKKDFRDISIGLSVGLFLNPKSIK